MQSLNGKVVLVTGAARRIGRGIALRLHREADGGLLPLTRAAPCTAPPSPPR